MISDCPCRYCVTRTLGCHGFCELYKEWSSTNKQMNKQIRHNRHQKGIGYLGEHYRRNCK